MTELARKVQPHALVVDDSSTVRRFHRKMLEDAGWSVIEASDGIEGLERALTHDLDMILLDVNMPEMDGYTFVRRLREDPRVGATPIVMISTEARQSDADSAAAAGANFYLVKPAQHERMTSLLRLMVPGAS